MKLVEQRGSLVGAMVCDENDQLFAIASNGVVIRTRVGEIRPSGRDTMGVTLMNLDDGDLIVAVARGDESDDDDSDETDAADGVVDDGTAVPVDGEAVE
jgi:DNA gyrase subunit A